MVKGEEEHGMADLVGERSAMEEDGEQRAQAPSGRGRTEPTALATHLFLTAPLETRRETHRRYWGRDT